MQLRTALAILCIASAASPSAGWAKSYDLKPSSKWWMDYAPDSCSLARTFGEGDDKIIAQFIRYEPSASFDLNLVGKPLGSAGNEPVVRIRFGIVGGFVESDAMTGSAGKAPAIFMNGRLDNLDDHKRRFADISKLTPNELTKLETVEPSLEASVTFATIVIGGRTIVIELGSMAAAMAEMRKCTTDLVKQWGLDPAEQTALLSRPRPRSDPAGWLHSDDYPTGALARGEQAIVRFRLMIAANGEVTSCAVQSALAKGNFAELSCDLLKRRARFDPARTADGRAVPSYYVNGVRWVIRG